MEMFGKSLGECVQAVRTQILLVFIVVILQILALVSHQLILADANYIAVIALALIIWAGWASVRKHGFNLKQAAIAGITLFIPVSWAPIVIIFVGLPNLPIQLRILNSVILVLINLLIYVVFAVLGGWLAKKIRS
jgi:hypothetical protein